MKRFKNILALYGDMFGADDVFEHSVELAKANNARLTLLDVLPERYTTLSERAERQKRMDRIVPAVRAKGVEQIAVQVLVGQPFIEIIRKVIANQHDIVIASAEGGASLRDLCFGSTATHLMRKCPCPVWVVKPGQAANYRRILACVDPRSRRRSDNELDVKILDLATSLAASNQAELHVIHAWDVEGKDRDTLASEVPDRTRQDILLGHEGLHRDRLDRLMAPYPLSEIRHRVHLPRGLPHKAIVEAVEEHEIDLIVMGTVSRTGIAGLIMGNAAESVLSAVRSGVFTVKPKGFRSPVILLEDDTSAELRKASEVCN